MHRQRRMLGLALLVLGVVPGGYWWNEHRRVGLGDVVSPGYWIRRWQGEDLWDARRRILFHGNRNLPEVALTIDDGPHRPTGAQLLDVLKAHRVRATFFVVGAQVKQHPDLARRMLAEGHEVGNHTQDHQRLDTLEERHIRNEIAHCDLNFRRATGQRLTLLRPPGLRYNDDVLRVAGEMGCTLVAENVTAHDATPVPPEFIVRRVLRRVENGSILLLHDDFPATAQALPRILTTLRERGYRFVTISEMLAHLPSPAATSDQ